jgi:mono/diheme cytochrome c family protein
MRSAGIGGVLAATLVAAAAGAVAAPEAGPRAHAGAAGFTAAEVARGAYLVTFGGCNDCHTPKTMTPRGPVPDRSRLLSGHPASVAVAAVPTEGLGPGKWMAVTNGDLTAWAGPWGVSYGANLTPDHRTGLGDWTLAQFVDTMRTGRHLGVGRPLLPPMPWQSVASLSDSDLRAVFAYLRSIKPIDNEVPAPVPPGAHPAAMPVLGTAR